PGYEARLLDDHGEPVPSGGIGNLWIKGDSICAGYWNQPEKTNQTIEGDWIRTGDKYTQDANGYFWYAGRSDDMLKVGGLWVSPVVRPPRRSGVRRHRARGSGRPDQTDGLRRPASGHRDERRAGGRAAAIRQGAARRLQASTMGGIPRRVAEDRHREDSALSI